MTSALLFSFTSVLLFEQPLTIPASAYGRYAQLYERREVSVYRKGSPAQGFCILKARKWSFDRNIEAHDSYVVSVDSVEIRGSHFHLNLTADREGWSLSPYRVENLRGYCWIPVQYGKNLHQHLRQLLP